MYRGFSKHFEQYWTLYLLPLVGLIVALGFWLFYATQTGDRYVARAFIRHDYPFLVKFGYVAGAVFLLIYLAEYVHRMILGAIYVSVVSEVRLHSHLSFMCLAAGLGVGWILVPIYTLGATIQPFRVHLFFFGLACAFAYVPFWYRKNTDWDEWGSLVLESPETAKQERKRLMLEGELKTIRRSAEAQKAIKERVEEIRTLQEEIAPQPKEETKRKTRQEKIADAVEELNVALRDNQKHDIPDEDKEQMELQLREKFRQRYGDIIDES